MLRSLLPSGSPILEVTEKDMDLPPRKKIPLEGEVEVSRMALTSIDPSVMVYVLNEV